MANVENLNSCVLGRCMNDLAVDLVSALPPTVKEEPDFVFKFLRFGSQGTTAGHSFERLDRVNDRSKLLSSNVDAGLAFDEPNNAVKVCKRLICYLNLKAHAWLEAVWLLRQAR